MSFTPDYTHGKLVVGSYTIPNYAVMFVDDGPLGMWFASMVGDDVETVSSTITYPRVEKAARVTVPLIVSMTANASGTPASNRTQQLLENVAALTAAVDPEGGEKSVTYTPWIGANPLTVTIQFEAPVLGSPLPGIGARVALPMVLEAGAVTDDGPTP